MSLSDIMKQNLRNNFNLGNVEEFTIISRVLKKYGGRKESPVVPEGVEKIGSYAFHGNQTIKHVDIPEGVRYIRDHAFLECKALESVTLPESLVSIGESAFCMCKQLKYIKIPCRVTTIGKDAFLSSGLKAVTLPESLTEIGEGAFQGCSSLESVQIPSGVAEIKKNTFAYCSSLSECVIPEGVQSIEAQALFHCEKLKEIYLPDSIRRFHNDAIDYQTGRQIFYRGLSFDNTIQYVYESGYTTTAPVEAGLCVDMICNHIFYRRIPSTVREVLIFQMFLQNPEEEKINLYLKEHFSEDFRVLIDYGDIQTIRLVMDSHQFLNQENIDALIEYVIEKQLYEIQTMLTDYKYRYIGFESDEEIIRKKFEL